MRYHWTTFYEKTSDKDPAEHIVAKEVIGPSTFTATSGITFLFVKILGFKPTTFEEFVAMYPNIFDPSMGYPALKDNRRNGISCRTWIFRVLSRMVQVGRIVRSAELESLNKLEQFMTERSLANEKSLNEGSGVFNVFTRV
ncbi:hypothetical protein BDP27DRAFT_1321920 [Rhodocollybia butyracea]|uniref:Uncharacterized protein n=1 Tax=Rhodocollybia butyracea TaxID=206335 RepID=A0A9P5Q0A1_9AGAR|nr:hypothetical protein BDP27DRAFT_1321920 [Rhodocollybia butyracea]